MDKEPISHITKSQNQVWFCLQNIFYKQINNTILCIVFVKGLLLQPLTKILRQIADLQQKLTFQATWKVLIFSLEMTRLLKIEKWLEASALGCHPAKNGHVTH